MDAVAMELFNGVDVEQTSAVWENLDGQRPVHEDVAADPDEEAVKNAEVVFEWKVPTVPTTRSGNRTRNASEASSSGCKKRRKTKLDE